MTCFVDSDIILSVKIKGGITMDKIFSAFLMQLIFTVGIIVLFGLIIAMLNKAFYRNLSGAGMTACYITGFIGTPIHELSHALFCVLFGHRIVEIKLFQISGDGTLGYVNHSYNKRNIYHNIGNFFIGVAPIIGIALAFYGVNVWLVPDMAGSIVNSLNSVDYTGGISAIFNGVISTVGIFFSYANSWQWWVLLIIGIFLALHMTLSGADIKGAFSGIIAYVIVLFLINLVLGLININLMNGFTSIVISLGSFLVNYLIISAVISIVAVLVSFIIKKVFRL